jgi:hypothetical protein
MEDSGMSGGTGSTLVVRPRGLTALTMGLEGAEPYAGTSPYVVPLQTVDFNEELRVQVVYDEAPPGEGGVVVDAFGPLVPVTWRVVIKSATRAGMIAAYNDLQAALLNPTGGLIEYKPEDLDAGILSTYYHYVTSPPPRLVDAAGNRWDAAPRSDGYFTLLVDVVFLTQPVATSDPDNPATLGDLAVTLRNWVDTSPAQANRVTVQAANLKGTLPALVRILAQPGSGQGLGRLIVFRRSDGTLANFVSIYEAEGSANIYPSVAWSEVTDADRGGGAYLRCLPPVEENGAAQGRRFTIANPRDHEGRFAVFGIGREALESAGQWSHKVKLVCGNTVQDGDDYSASMLGSWCLIYAGEFELPPSPLSDSEAGYHETPCLEWYSTRASGETEFWLDGILLVYVGDERLKPTALDVPCDDGGGVDDTEKLLVENFPDEDGRRREIAHVVAAADGDLVRLPLTAPRGDFLVLPPDKDSLLVFVQERSSGHVILDDDFEGYDSRILDMTTFDYDESWSATSGGFGSNTSDRVEGDRAIVSEPVYSQPMIYESEFELTLAEPLDLSNDGRLGGSDFLVMWIEILQVDLEDAVATHITFCDSGDNETGFAYAIDKWSGSYAVKRSNASSDTADLTDIVKIKVHHIAMSNLMLFLTDFFRIEKADPDDASNPNATGTQWDFQPVGGYWTLTQDVDGAGRTLACLDNESGVEKAALVDETTPGDVRFRARVLARRDAGLVGIVWRAGQDTLTAGAEDCYAALLDVTNDDLLVREYANGTPTALATVAFTSAVDTWYVLGVVAKGSTFRVYGTAATSLTDDDDVFDEAYLLATVEDTTLSGGQCGVMSVSTLGRFDEVKLVSLEDKFVPADTITLEGQAIFRTIAPFCE